MPDVWNSTGGGYPDEAGGQSEPVEASLALDYMAMLNRAIHMRPASLAAKTHDCVQAGL